jgi:FkbM family methyltransferase
MQAHRLRGGFRLEAELRTSGRLDVLVECNFGPDLKMALPLYLLSRNYSCNDPRIYESALVSETARVVAGWPSSVTLIDCGADLGIMAFRLASACANIRQIIAIEPHPESFSFLADNMRRLGVKAEAIHSAVADYCGRGVLLVPAHDSSDHAAFLQESPSGNVRVIRLDDLNGFELTGVLVKVDVEGGEAAVLRGARRIILESKRLAVVFEAHPGQAQRTGIDPVETIRLVSDVRDCTVTVCERPTLRLNLDQSFFSQVPASMVYNVLVHTTAA